MTNSRRDILKLGATAAAAGLGTFTAQAQVANPPLGRDAGGGNAVQGAVKMPKAKGVSVKLVTYVPASETKGRLGLVRDDGRVVDLAKAGAGSALPFDASDMLSLIAAGDPALDLVRQFAATAQPGPALADVRLLAPIPHPTRNVYAVGWNYLEHFEEGQQARSEKREYPAHPVFFTKAVGTVNGPNDPIPYDPKVSTAIDWECELAVVIGKRGINIAEADALNHVYGYTVINDTTARDIQTAKHGGQWFKGKSLDGHGPIGPWIVPADALDPDNLSLVTRVNGVVKQQASTKQMYFKVPRIVAELSLGMALEPGDIIATGTPPGVGFARKPPEFLKPGDVMETEIVEIGTLRNVIQQVPA